MGKRLKSAIRATSFVFAFVFFFMTASSAYAWTAQPDLQVAEKEVHYSNDSSTNNESSKRTKRFAPALPWIGMGVGELLKWLTSGAAVAVITHEAGEAWTTVGDMVQELNASNRKDKPKFFVAKSVTGNLKPLYIGKPLTRAEAIRYLQANPNNEIWTYMEKDALGLAMHIGQGRFDGPEIHNYYGRNDTLYYWHYHAKRGDARITSHIFYGERGEQGLGMRRP
ncbi:hypothetical protein [Paenibacillus thiaminolyticus]|uniref:hypothetical protein n=1 Tax=Paenibacillus thiaminolyticus TaxID=49283 RepID=UPI002542D05E|nr:hypothetical protein [Paenibacillus thiaminolyticus]WII37328.1 hypothetical protein O0V01_27735 [Paenibacillus thiaminolyticus]